MSFDKAQANLDLNNIKKVSILELRRNLGHQRAIAIGLSYVEESISTQAVVVMDGDGEDSPVDVIRLFEKCQEIGFNKLVFAQRTKRTENVKFRFFYLIYRLFFILLTGKNIYVGNFSIIPDKILSRVVIISEIWNHYAVGVSKARIPCLEIKCQRSTRLAGKPKMNFVSLVTHGLSAISVYGDVVGVRLLVVSCTLILLTIILITIIVAIKLFTSLAIPGWTSYISILLVIILLQFLSLSASFIFLILNGRSNYVFIPKRDYSYFVLNVQEIFSQP